jgi:prepilin-type N-terminal cleavage/methylation domain-containing protein
MKNLNRTTAGFTLMEIMVVIIVIAVLASVAGPMIGSITDQGRASATKSKLSALKSALMAYNGDVGRYPFVGTSANAGTSAAYTAAWSSDGAGATDYFSNTYDCNVLMASVSFSTAMCITNYSRRWKGPYMDSDPTDFMYDSWGERIQYFYYNKGIWLRSKGPDMTNEACLTTVTSPSYDGDDILLSIAKVKF